MFLVLIEFDSRFSLTGLRVAFFFRIQHLSSLLQIVQMEKVAASARAREPGMLADSSHFRERRVHSADSLQDVVQHQELNETREMSRDYRRNLLIAKKKLDKILCYVLPLEYFL